MPKKTFESAIEAAECLQLVAGLQAIDRNEHREGRGKISAKDSRCLLGSSYIDGDCLGKFPSACRWDYVFGYDRSGIAVAHFVEVHGAATGHDVSKMKEKLQWLRSYLGRETQARLASLTREIHWVASGTFAIPSHTPHGRELRTSLRKLGLKNLPVEKLDLA